MKKLLLFQLLFCVTVLSAQYTQTRVLHVKSENVTQFEEAVAKKTKMFNGPQSEDRFLTFKILSGPNANQYMRVRFEANLSGFDYIDNKGYNYWKQNVMPFYVEGRVAFWRPSGGVFSSRSVGRSSGAGAGIGAELDNASWGAWSGGRGDGTGAGEGAKREPPVHPETWPGRPEQPSSEPGGTRQQGRREEGGHARRP